MGSGTFWTENSIKLLPRLKAICLLYTLYKRLLPNVDLSMNIDSSGVLSISNDGDEFTSEVLDERFCRQAIRISNLVGTDVKEISLKGKLSELKTCALILDGEMSAEVMSRYPDVVAISILVEDTMCFAVVDLQNDKLYYMEGFCTPINKMFLSDTNESISNETLCKGEDVPLIRMIERCSLTDIVEALAINVSEDTLIKIKRRLQEHVDKY